jgi:hypothetical protein
VPFNFVLNQSIKTSLDPVTGASRRIIFMNGTPANSNTPSIVPRAAERMPFSLSVKPASLPCIQDKLAVLAAAFATESIGPPSAQLAPVLTADATPAAAAR